MPRSKLQTHLRCRCHALYSLNGIVLTDLNQPPGGSQVGAGSKLLDSAVTAIQLSWFNQSNKRRIITRIRNLQPDL